MLSYVVDGNEAAADIAYRTNEICIIYPITPASSMGELADQWSAEQRANFLDTVPEVVEMQSEGGVAGAMHGALQTGALATTFTASQGLLLMIPDMYRIAAELAPTVFHVASRANAPQGMSIYCEHSDVMATRMTGFALLDSATVQEAHDMALITQAASLDSKVPFLHFFDGFRTSHEVSKIDRISDETIKSMINMDAIFEHRQRRLNSEQPCIRGAVYNNDIFFQQREAVEPFYSQLPKILHECFTRFKQLTGREYNNVEYFGAKDAEYILVIMGSAANTCQETVEYLLKQNEKVGVIKIRLFQPFPTADFLAALPSTCQAIAVLDRTKEPGAGGEPLYQKIAATILQLPNKQIKVIAGRYGIGGKEFTPAMVKAIFAELKQEQPKHNFTIGINDDLSHSSLNYDEDFNLDQLHEFSAIFYGLGADGTVSANKNSIKIIGEETDYNVQGYFVYDAKKSGSRTVSHLRFSKHQINSSYLISSANFIGCHQFTFINSIEILRYAADGSILLLNSPFTADKVWEQLARPVQEKIINKKIKLFVVDAYKVAAECNLGNRINTIMQTCFFALNAILPVDTAMDKIKAAINKSYKSKGKEVVEQNYDAVNLSVAYMKQVTIPDNASSNIAMTPVLNCTAPEFVEKITATMLADHGDELPVNAIPYDGTFPSGTTKWENRDLSQQVPVWNPETCIQCGKCTLICPHAVLRAKTCSNDELTNAPAGFKSAKLRGTNSELNFTLQAYSDKCTGCGLCERTCPVADKAIKLRAKSSLPANDPEQIEFFNRLPETASNNIKTNTPNGLQFIKPLFEFSGACAGCGETPYVKLLSQLFGERLLVANACGCSSVYGGNLPTTPWCHNQQGQGPAWSSSLFEDNAEFGFGFLLSEEKHQQQALELLHQLSGLLDTKLIEQIVANPQQTTDEIAQQRQLISQLKAALAKLNDAKAKQLLSIADHLLKHSVWALGGDGWAYDIGFGGLDHVLASGRNINLLVLDTEVYSNTGGQASKASPRGSVVKFAANGKNKAKKDLGLMMMAYDDVYIASIAIGANPMQAIKAFHEAEQHDGPSLIIAYSHCIAHGFNLVNGIEQQQLAVKSGYWLLYRHDPKRKQQGLNPLQLDSKQPEIPVIEYMRQENRFKILATKNPEHANEIMRQAQQDIDQRWQKYQSLAHE